MRHTIIALVVVLTAAAVSAHASSFDRGSARLTGYEVWAVDQSDTTAGSGGTLYVYEGFELASRPASAVPRIVDLGGAARTLCLAQTGSAPQRPHMLTFSPSHSHGILAFVATGHVLFLNAAADPVKCIDVGAQAHAAFPARDGTYVVVANQNGKLLHRINTNYATETFTLDAAATLDLANGLTPSGALRQDPVLRPDNAPICPVVDASSRFVFTTLRGGGMFVVDGRATPMRIVAEYDKAVIHPNGCGGVETLGKMYITSGGGTAANPLESDLYAFPLGGFWTTPNPPNTPAPRLVFSHDARGFVDAHGSALMPHGLFLWVGDRAANQITVVFTLLDFVVNEIPLAGGVSADPAPDLMEASPDGGRVFVALRGPNPLTANVPIVNNAVGSTPGVGVIQVRGGGFGGELTGVAPISHVVGGVERADPHAVAVRRR